jgi:NAD(P)-dependent dehydrogenase (short-subunit alcohol dehydrogenase family)
MSSRGSEQVVWVAGVGAQAGLGAAVAHRFAREGFQVAVTGRTVERLEAVAAAIRESGGTAFAVPADVSREDSILAAVAKVTERGQLAAAIFNAGNFENAKSLDMSAEMFERAWRTNTFGGFIFGREVLRKLAPQGRGTLLFTGASASLRGKPPFGAFAAAKAGLRSVAQTFAREFGPQGVHVAHVVVDGAIDGANMRAFMPNRDADDLLQLGAIAETYWQLHAQPKSAWTQELDLRPYRESF